MRIKTSKGNEYQVDFIDGPTYTTGQVMLEYQDTRRLSEIAPEFDGLERIDRWDENQGDKTYLGYTELMSISRVAEGSVLIAIGKGEDK